MKEAVEDFLLVREKEVNERVVSRLEERADRLAESTAAANAATIRR